MATSDFATHLHLAGRRPFLSLSDLEGVELLVELDAFIEIQLWSDDPVRELLAVTASPT